MVRIGSLRRKENDKSDKDADKTDWKRAMQE